MNKVLFVFLLLIAIFLRIIGLDKGINGDEGALLTYAHADFSQIFETLKSKAIFPPLTPLLLHTWMMVSTSEIWIRLYFVLFGIGSCLVMYFMALEYGDRRFALLVFLLSAISPFLIWTSQHIRSYMDSTFWMLCSTYFFLKCLKNFEKQSWFGYIFFSTLAIYTNYINILYIIAQSLYAGIFDFSKVKKWFYAYVGIGVLFSPWFLIALGQASNATARKSYWDFQGFHVTSWLYLGRYVREAIALLGMDPEFLNIGISSIFSKNVLLFISILILLLLAFLIIKGDFLLFIFLAIMPLIFANFSEIFFSFRPLAKLFSLSHALFIFFIASVLYQRKYAFIFSAILCSLYISRLPAVYEPEYDTKKAYLYLKENIEPNEIVIMARPTNHYMKENSFSYLSLKEYLVREEKTGRYFFSPLVFPLLEKFQKKYSAVWFYKVEGNDSIFGANDLFMHWFKSNGYKVKEKEHFKRIDVFKLSRS